MCGICGVFQFGFPGNTSSQHEQVRKMTRLMERRGPDSEGFWSDIRYSVGFRRLSILDLSEAGQQPMSTIDGRYVLVFNGEVYNFREIRSELEKRGIYFRSTGDAEVVLNALVKWGRASLEKFNGMFALAFYDTVKQKILLARDHAGIKPLYFLQDSKGVVFASQYNQILSHPWAQSREVSQEALSLFLRLGHTPAPYAMLENTHLLEAGSWLTLDADGRREQGRFYQFPTYTEPTLRGQEAFDALDEVLSKAVQRHLISDVPVGVFLSGGIDSPLVLAEATKHSSTILKAFTIGSSDVKLDESQDARQYADELKVNHILRYANEQTALELLDDVVEASTEPTADFSIFPTLLVSQLASKYVKVVLSGDGGDELFWGYPVRFGAVLEQARYYKIPKMLRYGAIATRKLGGYGYATRDVLWPNVGRYYQKKHTIFDEKDLSILFPDLRPIPTKFTLFDFKDTDPDILAQRLRWNEFYLHLATILSKVDRASMHHSLEVRVPLLDKQVIAIAAQINWKTCLDVPNRLGKIPLRNALQKRLTRHTLRKKGFTVPMHQWLSGPLQPLLREKVINRHDVLGQRMNQSHLQKMNEKLLNGDNSQARGLWLLLSLALWDEHHLRPSRLFLANHE